MTNAATEATSSTIHALEGVFGGLTALRDADLNAAGDPGKRSCRVRRHVALTPCPQTSSHAARYPGYVSGHDSDLVGIVACLIPCLISCACRKKKRPHD